MNSTEFCLNFEIIFNRILVIFIQKNPVFTNLILDFLFDNILDKYRQTYSDCFISFFMKKSLLLIFLLFTFLSGIFSVESFAQDNRQQQFNQTSFRQRISNRQIPEVIHPFVVSGEKVDLTKHVSKFQILKIDPSVLEDVMLRKPADLRVEIPIFGGEILSVDLVQSAPVDEKTRAWAATDMKTPVPLMDQIHYHGIIVGQPNSTVAFSFFPKAIMGIAMTKFGNYEIGALNTEKPFDVDARYVVYNTINQLDKNPFICKTNEGGISSKKLQITETAMASQTCKAARIYFETDFDMFTKNGNSIANTQAKVAAMFNVVTVVYANEGITIILGDVKVWNVTDPYAGISTIDDILDEFRNNQIPLNPFTWNLAELIYTRNAGHGGLALLDVLCANDKKDRAGASNINNTFQPLPTYSWTINVISHEMGHNFGSPHTHNCNWPGGAIDGCEAVEGPCTRPPNADPGTIMSYCHLVTSVDLNLGFGPLPGNLIRNRYSNATCLENLSITSSIISPTSPFQLCTPGNVTLQAATCTGCSYQWKRTGTNIPGANSNSYIANTGGNYTVVTYRGACRVESEVVSVVTKSAPCGSPNGTVSGGPDISCGPAPAGIMTLTGQIGTVTGWEISTDNFVTSTPVPITTNTFNYPGVPQSTCFRAIINGGASVSAARCITVITPPTVTTGVDRNDNCPTTEHRLFANSATAVSYSWQPTTGLSNPNVRNPTLVPQNTTTFTVTATDIFGCTGTSSLSVTVSPSGGVASVGNINMCTGDIGNFTLSGPIDGSITWQVQPNCTGPFQTATGTGVNAQDYHTDPLMSGHFCYRAQLTGNSCTWNSNVIDLNICGTIKLTCTTPTYSNNFNTWRPTTQITNTCFLGNPLEWTDDYSQQGWYAGKVTGAGTPNFNTSNGGCGSGIFNFGLDGDGNRGLGSQTDGSYTPGFGAKFVNSTGGTITDLNVQYTGKQWWRGSNGPSKDRLDFQYSLDATDINNGTWVDVNVLDFLSPQTSSIGNINGNVAPNKTTLTQNITGLNIPNGANFMIRWVDFDHPSLTNDDFNGIDDFSITATFNGGIQAPTSVTPPAEHCADQNELYVVSPVNGSGTVRYNWSIPGGCSGWSLVTANNTASTSMIIKAGSANCSGLTVTATDDCGTSAPFSFNTVLGQCLGSVGGEINPNQTICAGGSPTTFTLTGYVGSILRWEKSTDCPGFSNPTTISNNNPTFSQGLLLTTTCFRAVVQSVPSPPALSTIVTVVVDQPSIPGVSSADKTTVCSGESVVLTNTGSNGTIQWMEQPNCSGIFSNIGSPGQNPLTVNPVIKTCYRSSVTSGACPITNSNVVTIQTNPCQSVGGTINGPQTICSGSSPNNLNLIGSVGTIQYWESADNNQFNPGTTISNTTTNLTVGILTSQKCFRASVKNGVNPAVFSDTVCIQVSPVSLGGTLSANHTICRNQSSNLISLSGHLGDIVRWEMSTVPGFSPVTTINNTQSTYTDPNVFDAVRYYRVVVKNGSCSAVNSSVVEVRTDPNSVSGTLSTPQTVCLNTAPSALTLTGQTGNILRWEMSTSCATYTPNTVINNTTATYQPMALTETTCFRAVVKSGVCDEAVSIPLTITVVGQPNGGVITGANTICANSSGPFLLLTGYQGNIVRWEKSINNFVNVTTIPNTQNILITGPLTTTTCYRAVLNNPGCSSVTSQIACVTVLPAPVSGTVSANQTICQNSNATFNLSGQSGNIIRWETSIDNFVTPISHNVTTANFTLTNVSDPLTYVRAIVGNGACADVVSNIVTVTTTPPTIPGILASDQTVCANDNTGILNLAAYQGSIIRWEKSTNNFVSYTSIANYTDTYSFSNLTVTTQYRVVVQNAGCPALTSTVVKVTVLPAAYAGTLNSNMTVCSNANSGTLNLVGNNGTIVHWEKSTDNFSTVTTIANTNSNISFSNLGVNTQFRVVIDNSPCGTDTSNVATVTVVNGVVGGTVISNATVCANDNTGTLVLTGASGSVLRWEASTDNFVTITSLPNTTLYYVYNNLPTTTWFRAVVGGASCGSATSVSAKVVTVSDVVTGELQSIPNLSSGCSSSSGTMKLVGASGRIIRWERSTNNFATYTAVGNTTTLMNYNIATPTQYRVVLQNAPCTMKYSNVVNLSAGFSLEVTALRECDNKGKIVAVTNGGTTPYTYVITPNAGIQSPAGVFSNLPPARYTITVKDKNNCSLSKTVIIPSSVSGPMITNIINQNNVSARVDWMDVSPGGNTYQISYKPTSGTTWTTKNVANTTYTITGLNPNSGYHVRVRVKCIPANIFSSWSAVKTFYTPLRESDSDIVESTTQTHGISLYPNPNNGSFNLKFEGGIRENTTVKVFDVTGRVVMEKILSVDSEEYLSGEISFQISDVVGGIYFVQVLTGTEKKMIKMIIE